MHLSPARRFSLLTTTCLLLSLPAHAQYNDNRAAMERMDRMERDMQMLQRQLARGGDRSIGTLNDDMGTPAPGSAQTEVRLSALEEDLRSLRGKVEENEFQIRRLSENFEKMQKDVDFRFNELSQNATATPPATTDADKKPTPDEADKEKKTSDKPLDGKTTAGNGVLQKPKESEVKDGDQQFDQPRDLYNYAFRLLNQTRYEDAAKYFKTFTEKYPKDPLIGNAYYWLGETYYIRRDYPKAADQFRQGFEAVPSGPKAADNLLKLSMTLSALKRDKDACTVLDQLISRFKNTSTALQQKAQSERSRIGCK